MSTATNTTTRKFLTATRQLIHNGAIAVGGEKRPLGGRFCGKASSLARSNGSETDLKRKFNPTAPPNHHSQIQCARARLHKTVACLHLMIAGQVLHANQTSGIAEELRERQTSLLLCPQSCFSLTGHFTCPEIG